MDSERATGLPWIVGAPRTGGGARDLLALVIGRGWADTSIAGAGAHAVVAAVLRRELTRPIEVVGGGVHEVDVQIEVHLQDTVVLITGLAAGVRAAAARLEVLLTRPEELVFDIPGASAQRLAHPFAGWGRELAAWFGVGPAGVFADVIPTWSGSVDDLHAALRALRPGPELAAVGVTTVAEPAEQLLARVAQPAPGWAAMQRSALRWRTPEEAVVSGPVEHLLSVHAPGGVAGRAAMTVLVQTLQRSFEVMCPVRGLYAASCSVGTDELLTVTAQPHRELDQVATEAAVDAAVQALEGLAPEVIEAALAGQRSEEAMARRTGMLALALAAIRSGQLRSLQQLIEQARTVTVDDVRSAVAVLLSRILLTRRVTPPEVREKVPLSEIPGGSPKSWHPPTMPSPTAAGPRHVRVLVNGRRLVQQRSVTQRGYGGQPQTVMDLERVVAQLDVGRDATVLIDDRDRRIQLLWPALMFPGRLRRVLDTAIPAERRMTLASDGQPATSLTAYKKRAWRIVGRAFAILALLGVALVAIVVFTGNSTDADSPGTIIDTTIGQTATLPNGTAITVSDPRVVDDPRNSGGLLLADVRYCAGSVQPSKDRDYEIRNYVDSTKFDLYGTDNNRSSYRPAGVETFDMTTLAAGECLDRTIVFEVLPANLPEAGIFIQFGNVVNDQVTWRGVRPTR